jgi:hypothetical protein
MLYRITYNDNSIFEGGTIKESKWDLIIKPIKRIEYFIGKKTLILENYESYNNLVEKSHPILGEIEPYITKHYMMGLKDGKVQVIIWNFNTKKFEEYISDFGSEYNKRKVYNSNGKILKYVDGFPSTGWKEGLINLEPHYFSS